MENWNKIIEAQFEDLIQLKATMLALPESAEHIKQLQYINILLAYFRQDAAEIERLIPSIEDADIRGIAQARFWIRSGNFSDMEQFAALEKQATQVENRALRGEFYFVLATASQSIKNFRKATDYFLAASGVLESAKAHKKSLRSLQNYVAAHSCEFPEARLFSEYTSIYKSAIALLEFQTAATALLNISREFQKLEALAVSLDYAVQAEELFMQHGPGSREHGFCLLHKSHILLQMDRSVEAKKALQFALVSKHVEVLTASQVLAEKLGVAMKPQESEQMVQTWNERILETPMQRVLGELEGKLISLLAEGPKDKSALMDSLYGDKICFEARENRFKNLMSRVRTKLPGLIVLKNSNYEIVDSYALGDTVISQRSAK